MTVAQLSPEQLALRRQGLGASEVAAVLGLDPFSTALDVYLEKTGQAAPFPENRFMRWGKRLEAVIADEYAEQHPEYRLRPSGTLVGPEPWMLATPDRLIVDQDGLASLGDRVAAGDMDEPEAVAAATTHGLECKSRGHFNADAWGETGTDEVPHSVAVQCHWGMIVTGLRRWDVAVLLGGNDYREFTLTWDDAIALELVARARAFWFDHVLAKVHPPFTGADSDHRFLLKTYPGHTGEMVPATPEVGEWATLLQVHRAAIETHEAEKSRLEAHLKEFIADRLGVEGPFGKITWKHVDAVEVSAFTRQAHRRLNVKFAKALD